MPDLLFPLKLAVATVLSGAHTLLTFLGLPPDGGLSWASAIALVVLAVRVALVPLVAYGVRAGHAAALAAPRLAELRARYADRAPADRGSTGRRDLDAMRAMAAERRAIQAEHGVSRLGCLPALLQVPLVFALYAVLSDVSAGRALGAMDAALVASAGTASLLGVRLADRLGALTAAPGQAALVTLLAAISAALSYATQRWFVLPNLLTDQMPAQLAAAQRMLPALSAAGLLLAAGAVPVGLLIYWVVNNAVTLIQQAVITRWWPTPGSPAAARRSRHAG